MFCIHAHSDARDPRDNVRELNHSDHIVHGFQFEPLGLLGEIGSLPAQKNLFDMSTHGKVDAKRLHQIFIGAAIGR